MASASRLVTDEDFLCSICLEVFTDPVALPCGHDFCLNCITKHWDTKGTSSCPLCNKTFTERPLLCVNTRIASIAEKFKEPQQPDISGTGYVLCNLCGANNTTPAIKSCLTCLVSYCATHLERHQSTPALMRHRLIQPVEDLESRICKIHHQPLDYVCRNGQQILCYDCLHRRHKSQNAVKVEVWMKTKLDQLKASQEKIDEMIRQRQEKIDDLQNSVQTGKTNVERARSGSWKAMNASIRYIRRSFAELQEVLDEKQTAVEAHGKGLVKEIEKEIVQLTQKKTELQQLQPNDDCIHFLQSVRNANIRQPALTNNWDTESIDCDYSKVEEAVNQLQKSEMKEAHILCDPDLPAMQRHSVKVVLDPETAHHLLSVSEDGKQVQYGRLRFPWFPQRVDCVCNVLAKEGFNANTFYYEVQVKGKTDWDLGVASESINRKGEIRLSPQNGYWTICLRKGNEYTANAGPAVVLNPRKKPQKISIFVNYEVGLVAFYDVEESVEIHAFTGCTFTEKLFPFFSPGPNVDGNRAPLIITPVIVKQRDHSWSDEEYDDRDEDWDDD
ncbi:unnamed protein product [Arctogadus glacialis]